MKVHRMGRLVSSAIVVPFVVLGLAFVAVGCGGGGDDGDSAGDASSNSNASQSTSGESSADGAVPNPDGIKDKRIGMVAIAHECEGCLIAENGFLEATKHFGWNVQVEDGQGDPVRIGNLCSTLVQSGVDAVVMQSADVAWITKCLEQAKEKNIPVIDIGIGGAFDYSALNNGLTAVVDANAVAESALMTDVFIQDLNRRVADGEIDGKAKIAVFDGLPGLGIFRLRKAAMESMLAENKSTIEVVATHVGDQGNIIADTRSAIDSILTAHPDIDGVWTIQDSNAPVIAQALRAHELADKVSIGTFVGGPSVLKNMRDNGPVKASAVFPTVATQYHATDTLARIFTGQDFSPLPNLAGPNAATATVVTPDNVPPEGESPEPTTVPDALVKEWQEKYGIS